MTRVMQARLAFAAMGVGIWGYAFASENETLRLVGIALLALSLVLRFVPGGRGPGRRGRPTDHDDDRASP